MLKTRERRNSLDAEEYQEAPAISNFILLVHAARVHKKSHLQCGLIRSNSRKMVIPNDKSVSSYLTAKKKCLKCTHHKNLFISSHCSIPALKSSSAHLNYYF